jgi:hypothetical protein
MTDRDAIKLAVKELRGSYADDQAMRLLNATGSFADALAALSFLAVRIGDEEPHNEGVYGDVRRMLVAASHNVGRIESKIVKTKVASD